MPSHLLSMWSCMQQHFALGTKPLECCSEAIQELCLKKLI